MLPRAIGVRRRLCESEDVFHTKRASRPGEFGVLELKLQYRVWLSGLELCVRIVRLDDPDLRDIE